MTNFNGGFIYDSSLPGAPELYEDAPGTRRSQKSVMFELNAKLEKAQMGDDIQYKSPSRVPSRLGDLDEDDAEGLGLRKILFDFGDYVSAAGLPRVFTERSTKWGRLLYAVVFLASFSTSLYYSIEIIREYYRYPTTVKVEFHKDSKMDFPSVTVCNTNRVRYSAILQSKHSDLEYLLSDRSLGGLYYPPCLADDMLCANDECLRRFKVCDGIRDCDDGGDEENCYYGTCGYRQHRCDTGGDRGYCISDEYVCDGNEDCYDLSDESDCSDNCQGFACADGSDCLSLDEECDGTVDCTDGSDESNCTTSFTCPSYMVKCATIDVCIYTSWVCDNYADCSDRSDEPPQATCPTQAQSARKRRNVVTSGPTASSAGSSCYWCVPKYGTDNVTTECFPSYYECDGYEDCQGGTDENNCGTITYNCPVDHFACDDGTCFHEQFMCDGWDDCTSGSDENNCGVVSAGDNITISDLFQTGWSDRYRHITDDEGFYSEFEGYYLNEKYNVGFERVDSEDPPDWHGFATFSATGDFSDLEDVVKLTAAEILELGHQAEDLILQCTFDQVQCSYDDFVVIQDDKYGNCFTFNHYATNDTLSSSGPGSTHGLKLTLFTEQSEYVSIYGQDSGVRVSIHEQGKTSFPEDDGFTVAPGKATGVGLKQTLIYREDPPHGSCSNTTSFESIYGDEYSITACRKQCLQSYLESECGCVDTSVRTGIPRCQILNKTQEICRTLMKAMMRENQLECLCEPPCNEIAYTKTISQSLWPSEKYLYHLLKTIHSINSKTKDINDFEQAQLNLARLEVYFEEMTYAVMKEEPKYEGVYNLLSEIGGVIGLYVGLSFITVVEFVEFFFSLIKYGFRRITKVDATPKQ